MGFLLFFNHSKYTNYTYVLINKPLNHLTKIIYLDMADLNLANLSIKESPVNSSDTHSPPPNTTAPLTSTTTPTQIFNTQLYTSITLSPHTSSFTSPTRIPPPPPPPSNTITSSHSQIPPPPAPTVHPQLTPHRASHQPDPVHHIHRPIARHLPPRPPAPNPTPLPIELMTVTASPASSRSNTPFFTPNHTPLNTPIHSPVSMMLTEPTQTKRKREDPNKHKVPKRPKNKHKAQKHKPQHPNQSSSKQAEPEPKRSLNRHPITGGERPQSRFKLEVYPSSKIGGSLTASDLDRELLFCPEVSVTALRALGGGVVLETATAEAATIAKRYLEGKGYRALQPTKLGIRAFFKVPENYKNIDPKDLVRALCLRNQKHGLGEDSLQFVSTNRRMIGAEPGGKEVTRHWVDIDPAAVEVLKRTSWHIETTSSTIRIHPVTKDDSVSQ